MDQQNIIAASAILNQEELSSPPFYGLLLGEGRRCGAPAFALALRRPALNLALERAPHYHG